MINNKEVLIHQRQMKRIDAVIGIDPDVEKNGVAYLDCRTKDLKVTSMSFPDLLDYIRYAMRRAEITQTNIHIVIEAGWLNKSNWHLSPKDTKQSAAAKGNAAGRNHEVGRKIAEMCQHWNVSYELMKPLALKIGGVNLWKSKDGKITHEELAAITGITAKTNQEGRDAALIAWVWAGFSVKKR